MSYVVGMDLSGPSNAQDTALVAFRDHPKTLVLRAMLVGASDPEIVDFIGKLGSSVVVGMDAPLSYAPRGGLREADAELQERAVAAGLRPGAVMPPTMTRMAYLTLRGLAVSRLLERLPASIRIVEVHPGACMALRGAPVVSVRRLKRQRRDRHTLLHWLRTQGLREIPPEAAHWDHSVAACAAALAAWQWSRGNPVWCHPAEPPHHPYDYAV